MAHTFVLGSDLFAFADSSWELIRRKLSDQNQVDVGEDGAGEYIPDTAKTFDEKTEVVLTYRAKVTTAGLTVAVSLGLAAASGYVPTQVVIRTKVGQGGLAEVEITGHKHGSSTHEVNSVDFSERVDGWGATDFMASTANDGCQSSTITATINHKDAIKKDGTFLCGRSQGCRVEGSADYIADSAPALGSSWTDNGSDTADGGDFWTATLKGVKWLTPT